MPQRSNGSVYRMKKPKICDVKLTRPRLKYAGSILRPGKELLLFLKRLQQPPDDRQKFRAGGKLRARGDEFGIVYQVPSSIAAHARNGDRLKRIVTLGFNQNTNVFLPNPNLFFIASIVDICHSALDGNIANRSVTAFQVAVGLIRMSSWNGQHYQHLLAQGRELVSNVT